MDKLTAKEAQSISEAYYDLGDEDVLSSVLFGIRKAARRGLWACSVRIQRPNQDMDMVVKGLKKRGFTVRITAFSGSNVKKALNYVDIYW